MEKEKQFFKKEIPIGTGRESEPKETLPAIKVDNEVIWVNPNFPELPLNIKEGEPTKLGMFLTPKPKEGEEIFGLKIITGHYRSGLLGRAIFKDNDGHLYRDIDLKGGGSTRNIQHPDTVGNIERREGERGAWGILNREWAEHARDKSEDFLRAGIRTERYIALVSLKEIVDENANKISIKEAKKRKMLYRGQRPVVAIRALGTKFRILDSLFIDMSVDMSEEGQSKGLEKLKDAKALVAQEIGLEDKEFSWEDYLTWFYKTAGKNLGLMHKNGWSHNYLTVHNITLDCRIVDLDSVDKIHTNRRKKIDKILYKDYDHLLKAIRDLFCKIEPIINLAGDERESLYKRMVDTFNKTYTENLGCVPKFVADFWKEAGEPYD